MFRLLLTKRRWTYDLSTGQCALTLCSAAALVKQIVPGTPAENRLALGD